ncbi:hypothetical protein L6164_014201 [Bauhinia variegata]|uniref:Uncharacterized protein n=1 Tax=Bauhinia variegata TaxID=167791 RepID=A0ACB9NHH1_BAUVA|nr:hypothetical protein L6164_014201 [Bauhinia variegata]
MRTEEPIFTHIFRMAMESCAAGTSDEIRADILTKAREACYKVTHFDWQYCRDQRLLDDKERSVVTPTTLHFQAH